MQSESNEIQLYFSRVRPIYSWLFNIAHAITGNCEQAEYSLQYAMMDFWSETVNPASRHGFREGLKSTLVRTAVKDALNPKNAGEELTWDGLKAVDADAEHDPIMRLAAAEAVETRRMLTLKYGCGLPLRTIARIMHSDAAQARQTLERFEARARRRLSAVDRRRWDVLMARAVKNDLMKPGSMQPEIGNVLRTFQADAAAVSRPGHLPARIAHSVLTVVLTLILVVLFWFAAVLIQPPVIEGNAVETAAPQPTAQDFETP